MTVQIENYIACILGVGICEMIGMLINVTVVIIVQHIYLKTCFMP